MQEIQEQLIFPVIHAKERRRQKGGRSMESVPTEYAFQMSEKFRGCEEIP
jgi:hypothetical protein